MTTTAKPNPAQAAAIAYFHDGTRSAVRFNQRTYAACRSYGWLAEIEEFPFHRATDAGVRAIDRETPTHLHTGLSAEGKAVCGEPVTMNTRTATSIDGVTCVGCRAAYDAYRAKLTAELRKFARGEAKYGEEPAVTPAEDGQVRRQLGTDAADEAAVAEAVRQAGDDLVAAVERAPAADVVEAPAAQPVTFVCGDYLCRDRVVAVVAWTPPSGRCSNAFCQRHTDERVHFTAQWNPQVVPVAEGAYTLLADGQGTQVATCRHCGHNIYLYLAVARRDGNWWREGEFDETGRCGDAEDRTRIVVHHEPALTAAERDAALAATACGITHQHPMAHCKETRVQLTTPRPADSPPTTVRVDGRDVVLADAPLVDLVVICRDESARSQHLNPHEGRRYFRARAASDAALAEIERRMEVLTRAVNYTNDPCLTAVLDLLDGRTTAYPPTT